ncbi:MAG: N-acetylglucosamine-6-phosphate deacetylase [Acidimicrobiales bacterium]
MSELSVQGASVWRDARWRTGDVTCRDGAIVDDAAGPDATTLGVAGMLVVSGFIDLQCNGGLGIDLASNPERLWDLGAQLPRWGVTAWLPTIVTTPPGIVERALATLAAGPPPGWVGAEPLGLHLEGPFLSPAKRGAHPAALLRPATMAAIDGWSRAAGVALVTLAPELEGALEVIEALVERGVVVSLGHSAATADQAMAGVDAGATWVTHLFNAMVPLHHREPGLAGVALTDERLHVGLIADGIHVDPSVVTVAQRALGDRLTLVTDAVAALGMPEGRQALGRSEVTVDADGVRLADGTLAGSNLAMDQAVRNLMAFTGCSAEVAVCAGTEAPARVLGDERRGTLAVGSRADLVVLDGERRVVATVIGGRIVHDAR